MPLRRSGTTRSSRSSRSNSFDSTDGSVSSQGSRGSKKNNSNNNNNNKRRSKHGDGKLPPPILVYHESAHSIVFRDHLRRVAAKRQNSSTAATTTTSSTTVDKKQQSSSASSHGNHTPTKTKMDRSSSDDASSSSTNAAPTITAAGKTNATTGRQVVVEEHPEELPYQPRRPPHHDTLIEVASEFTHMVGLDHGETVMPSQAQIPSDQIANFRPRIQPLPRLELGPDDAFLPLQQQPPFCVSVKGTAATTPVLVDASPPSSSSQSQAPSKEPHLSEAEREVVYRLRDEQACVKTIRNGDWTAFLTRFQEARPSSGKWSTHHMDIPPHRHHIDNGNDDDFPFNSFVTSTSLLPPYGQKMRCFGAIHQFTVGVVFALPQSYFNPHNDNAPETEEECCQRTRTWSWPAGYSAKTEFNIDGRGNLMNGREEAIAPLPLLRIYNHAYLNESEYIVAGRKVSGLSQIPYNEIFLRVGGRGRIAVTEPYQGDPTSTTRTTTSSSSKPTSDGRSLDYGVGLPIALFVRSTSFGHLISLLRTRSRCYHVLGEKAKMKDIPLLVITPEEGTRVFTEELQVEFWKVASRNLNPFQNPALARRTTIDNMDEVSFRQKVDELLDLDDGTIRERLTPDELAHLAGGFGATDESVASILKQVMLDDIREDRERRHVGVEGGGEKNRHHPHERGREGEEEEEQGQSHHLQDFVNEGLTAAVRSGDFLTARQLLILYSVVAARKEEMHDADDESLSDYSASEHSSSSKQQQPPKHERTLERRREGSMGKDAELLVRDLELAMKKSPGEVQLSGTRLAPPPPPPLDTDRLRGATNSDGLLAVLGAAQILKAMKDGGAKKRTEEVVDAVDDWCKHGEQSMAFRISSWYDQRAAQGDLQIATENDSSFMAFVSNKAIANRRNFAQQLRRATSSTDFTDVRFLRAIEEMVNRMHAPCLRLELLQYVLGLDNRFSVSHVSRAVHLAVTCLGVSSIGSIDENTDGGGSSTVTNSNSTVETSGSGGGTH